MIATTDKMIATATPAMIRVNLLLIFCPYQDKLYIFGQY